MVHLKYTMVHFIMDLYCMHSDKVNMSKCSITEYFVNRRERVKWLVKILHLIKSLDR